MTARRHAGQAGTGSRAGRASGAGLGRRQCGARRPWFALSPAARRLRRYADSRCPRCGRRSRVTFDVRGAPEPVLERGGDCRDVLNPSVAGRDMFYSEWDGRTWHTAQATSARRHPLAKAARVLSPDPRHLGRHLHRRQRRRAHASAAELWYWYVAGPARAAAHRTRAGLAQGAAARARARAVHELGRTRRRRSVRDPDRVHLLHVFPRARIARGGSGSESRGRATASTGRSCAPIRFWNSASRDRSTRTASASRPSGSAHGFYWMLYTGPRRGRDAQTGTGALHRRRPLDQARRRSSAARSAWDSKVICDPTVRGARRRDGRVWFGGGDVAQPGRESARPDRVRRPADGGEVNIGITCYPTYGGSGIVATELGLELATRGHEVHFITYANPIRLDPGHAAHPLPRGRGLELPAVPIPAVLPGAGVAHGRGGRGL